MPRRGPLGEDGRLCGTEHPLSRVNEVDSRGGPSQKATIMWSEELSPGRLESQAHLATSWMACNFSRSSSRDLFSLFVELIGHCAFRSSG